MNNIQNKTAYWNARIEDCRERKYLILRASGISPREALEESDKYVRRLFDVDLIWPSDPAQTEMF